MYRDALFIEHEQHCYSCSNSLFSLFLVHFGSLRFWVSHRCVRVLVGMLSSWWCKVPDHSQFVLQEVVRVKEQILISVSGFSVNQRTYPSD